MCSCCVLVAIAVFPLHRTLTAPHLTTSEALSCMVVITEVATNDGIIDVVTSEYSSNYTYNDVYSIIYLLLYISCNQIILYD